MPRSDFESLKKIILRGSPVTNNEFQPFLDQIDSIYDFRSFIKDIFDLNKGVIINRSEARKGVLGILNSFAHSRKNRRFKRLIKKGKNGRANKILVIAEGDSWFEYPLFLRDITDFLRKRKNKKLLLYNLSSGGDWISNMIYEEEYIDELSQFQPEIFLISGGGNDLVGGARIAKLINKESIAISANNKPINNIPLDKLREKYAYLNNVERHIPNNKLISKLNDYIYRSSASKIGERDIPNEILIGLKYLNSAFYSLLNQFRFQYLLLFTRIYNKGKFGDMKIITQGYDFAIPSKRRSTPLRIIGGNGNWLYYPLLHKGIFNEEIQRSIIAAMIHEFNEMLIDVGKNFDKVHHVDSRGAVAPDYGWADELHPRNKFFKRITKSFEDIIIDKETKRVISAGNNL